MRSSIILTAAFAATAFSTPMKRDVIVETDTATDIAYVTDVVTVTAGSESAASTPAAAGTTTTVASGGHWGHHHWHTHTTSSVVAVTSSSSEAAPAPSSPSEAAPAPSAYSTPAAPAPAPSSSSEAAPVPTSSSSSEAAPAPSSYSAPAPSSSTVATSTSAAPAGMATTYQQAVVNHHNYHRTNHSAPALTWDDNMASLAGEIANSCIYAHDMTKGTYGQNIAAGPNNTAISTIISNLFYNGEVNAFNGLYGQADPDMTNFESWGHFSQIVWKGTTSVGCATNACKGGLFQKDGKTPIVLGSINGKPDPNANSFTVCNYYPPGNVGGGYGSNIGDSLSQATVYGTQDVPQLGVTGNGY